MNQKKICTFFKITFFILFPISVRAQSSVATQAADSALIRVERAAPGSVSIYELAFVATDSVRPNASLSIIFPTDIDLTALEIVGSTSINGGLTFSRQAQQVDIRRSGRGEVIPPGRRLSVKFGMIRNPDALGEGRTARLRLSYTGQAQDQIEREISIRFIL